MVRLPGFEELFGGLVAMSTFATPLHAISDVRNCIFFALFSNDHSALFNARVVLFYMYCFRLLAQEEGTQKKYMCVYTHAQIYVSRFFSSENKIIIGVEIAFSILRDLNILISVINNILLSLK